MSGINRSLLFLLGLVLGLLAGAGFFIFKMDGILQKVNFFNAAKDTIIIRQQIMNNTAEDKGKIDIKKYIGRPSAHSGKDTSQKTMNSAEVLAKKYSREISSKKVMAEADSLLRDSAGLSSENISDHYEGNNFIVKKDELLGSKKIEVTNLQQNEMANSSDSLLEKISGIKDGKKNIVASFKVEFWQSPINYKGYKMTKNKIPQRRGFCQ